MEHWIIFQLLWTNFIQTWFDDVHHLKSTENGWYNIMKSQSVQILCMLSKLFFL